MSRKVVRYLIHRIAMGTPGVVQLGGDSIWKRLFKWLNIRTGPRGIELELADGEAAMTLTLVVRYGVRVPELSTELRRRIKRGLKQELGIEVRTVNIYIKSLKGVHPQRSGYTDLDHTAENKALLPEPREPHRRRFELDGD
ncbi:Asp23/Gls24 family envelope stress response protein [Planctomycetota bacterium]